MCRVKFSPQKDQDAVISSVGTSLSGRHSSRKLSSTIPLFIIGFSMTECVIQLIHNASTFKRDFGVVFFEGGQTGYFDNINRITH